MITDTMNHIIEQTFTFHQLGIASRSDISKCKHLSPLNDQPLQIQRVH